MLKKIKSVGEKLSLWGQGVLLVQNLCDAILSLYFIKWNETTSVHLEEANIITKTMMEFGDIPFVMLKILLVSLGVYILNKYNHLKAAQIATYACVLCYSTLLASFALFLF